MEYLNAFLCGGILCAVGQIIIDKTQLTPARILTGYVVVGVLLSALGLYEPLAQWGGAGATVPLTGFGHTLAKGCLSLTGYQGILGYRTQTDQDVEWTAEREANRQKEIEAVKPIIAELKRTGWTFGSHTWGHIRLGTKSLESIQADTQRWFDEVGSLVGPTTILFYPHGERPDGNDWQNTGPVFQYLQSQGFRVFASVGIESFSYIKKDLCAVICDRLHPDGTTLRHSRDRYLQFYDAKDIMDVTVRPQREIDWA